MNWRWIGYFALAFVVIQIPVIGTFFKIADTMIHESSHAIMTLLLQEKVLQIELFANTEGVTYSEFSSRTSSILISAAGYTGSSIAALCLAVLCARGKHAASLWFFLLVAAVNLVLWVRNPFGMTWLALFIGLLLFALWRRGNWTVVLSVGLYVFVLAESVSGSFTILWLSLHSPASAGDAANLARDTLLPAGFWGALFMLQAIVFGFLSVRTVMRRSVTSAKGRTVSY
ncbi:M50 family metallopeptidase [Cohnella sp. CFH 77786]|uniref:M50 family metallopeptidase n=1 Tax=Cohnella sp. CFH 77786 TaxID=2662265 RepID=UPI001C610B57